MSIQVLTDNALIVLRKRGYLKENESPDQMFHRVAKLIASADKNYGSSMIEMEKTERQFYRMMAKLEFLSGSVLLNAVRERKQFSACYVLSLSDSLEDIYQQLRNVALISRTGGGVGIAFTSLRPRGSRIESTGGVSSGAVSFARLFNCSAITISEASARRPAMMGVLRVDHPDIVEFITAKENPSDFSFFNFSIGATDNFMRLVKKRGGKIHLSHPNDGDTEGDIDVLELWNLIATQAWKIGDPGLVFLDRMNKDCPTPNLGRYEATNPCGEQPLLPYESCNLGNINLAKFTRQKNGKPEINWTRLEEVIKLGVHFLDNVIDLCDYPIVELKRMAKTTRRIGLGVMGWADMLVKLGVRYDSKKAIKLAEKIAKFIQTTARDASVELSKQRGSFPAFRQSVWRKKGFKSLRNSTVNTVAPTGTVSIIANCSSGIEPLFALVYRRENVLDIGKTNLSEVNQDFKDQVAKMVKKRSTILKQVSETGSCQEIKGVAKKIKNIFRVSLEIPFEWHIKMQAAWQKYTDAAVSKTVNLPNSATVEDVKLAYLLAFETGCKGITVYRDGCRDKQVLNAGSSTRCLECQGKLIYADGCSTCSECGLSKCS